MEERKTILVTGGSGFIGRNLVEFLASSTNCKIINVDKLTYASYPPNISEGEDYCFEKVDICDLNSIHKIFYTHAPDAVLHLAAESHVDRSILGPINFIQSNIVGTFNLLEASRIYWKALPQEKKTSFRFLHVSTDEVYGDLLEDDPPFTENTPYSPSSPYSASKASADHLVKAWHRTYGLPTLITSSSNNYGPGQYPEKLIPRMIINALKGASLPVYGTGEQSRDWIYVEDHVRALWTVLQKGQVGEHYNIGADCEVKNIEIIRKICASLDEFQQEKPNTINSHIDLITHVTDRPGHDQRYALNTTKIKSDLGWAPTVNLKEGLHKTISWYLSDKMPLQWKNV